MSRERALIATLAAVAATALLLCLTVPASRAEPGTDGSPVRASVMAGFIFRDDETDRAIESTRSIRIAPGTGKDLALVVTKSRYRLDALKQGAILKTYPIALGGEPVGPKLRMGDHKTPEGDYVLIPGHPSPKFGPCFYVCYPNEEDARQGLAGRVIAQAAYARILASLKSGEAPPADTELGGLILLHGTKDRDMPLLTAYNWTLGCIALENDAIEELLAAYAPSDRPLLTIRP